MVHQLTKSDPVAIGVAIIFMLLVGGIWTSLNFAICPKCKKHFFWKWYWANALTSKCLHCGLNMKDV